MKIVRRLVITPFLLVLLLASGPLLVLASGRASLTSHWATASQRPTGLAPSPASHPEAIVQVYAARTYNWRGAFAVHTWLAAKPAGADGYTRYEVIGWNVRRGGSAVSISAARAPDAEWFGSPPQIVAELRGARAQQVLARLPAVVEAYPYPDTYRAWPGPNSNTFIAYLGRELPELGLRLPPLAIGKDYLPDGRWYARTPSGTGFQVSFGGILGILAGPDDGIELNVLGLVAGIDPGVPALKLPGFGTVPP